MAIGPAMIMVNPSPVLCTHSPHIHSGSSSIERTGRNHSSIYIFHITRLKCCWYFENVIFSQKSIFSWCSLLPFCFGWYSVQRLYCAFWFSLVYCRRQLLPSVLCDFLIRQTDIKMWKSPIEIIVRCLLLVAQNIHFCGLNMHFVAWKGITLEREGGCSRGRNPGLSVKLHPYVCLFTNFDTSRPRIRIRQ